MRGRGGDFPALFFQRGATRPLCIPPQGEGLTCRFGRRRTLSTGELRPLATPLRGGAPPPSHPPRARSSLTYCKRGFQKIILAFAYPFRPGFAGPPPPQGEASLGSPYGGDGHQWRPSIAGLRSRSGRSWTRPTGAQDPNRQVRRCHGIAVTERGEPGTYSRPQPKIPERPSAEGFSLSSRVKLHFVQLTRSSKSRSAPLTRGHRPSPAPAPGSGSRRGAAGGWARRRGSRRAAPGPPGA